MSGAAKPARQSWDHNGAYEAALTRIIRSANRSRGCRLTAEQVTAMHFAEGDGDYFQALVEVAA